MEKEERRYRAALYLRLSRDDEDIGDCGQRFKRESDSITSQRELLIRFAEKQENMEIYDIYADDGCTGSNFERPQFQRMLEDIYAGRVNCVLVKDLSRFGREYIEAGRFLQKLFPALQVRFIAVTDGYDSLTASDNEFSLVLPIKNFVNDAYCRDISTKVKSHLYLKRVRGEFIGAFAVYGYEKDREKRNHLVSDPYAAEVVRLIFTWRLEGISAHAIAERLNERGVLSPLAYKRSKGENYETGFPVGKNTAWSAMAVLRILKNEIYTGVLEQGKSEKVSFKVDKYRLKPKEMWIRTENTHEPIVKPETFAAVQKLLSEEKEGRAAVKKQYLFAGMLYCGDCGGAMTRRITHYGEKERIFFICSTKNKGLGCTRHSISQEVLEKAVFAEAAEKEEWERREETEGKEAVQEKEQEKEQESPEGNFLFAAELHRLEGLIEQAQGLQGALEEDLKRGILKESEMQCMRAAFREREEQLEEVAQRQRRWLGTEPSRQQSPPYRCKGIDRIYIYEDKRIKIIWK